MRVFFSKKTLLVAALFAALSLALVFSPAEAASRTHYEVTLRVYDAQGHILQNEVTLSSDAKNLSSAGLSLPSADSSLSVVKAEDGDFYLGVRGVNAFLIANGKTQGGLRRLTKVSSAVPLNRLSSWGGLEYYRSGLSFGKDAIFAVYDKDTDAYYKIRVLKVIRTSIPDLVGIPTITSPKNDAAPSSLETNVTVAWKPIAGAEKYTLTLKCTSCDSTWQTHVYEFTGATQKYVLPLTGLPSGKQYYNITVQAAQGTTVTQPSYAVYFTYTNLAQTQPTASLATPVITSPTANQVFSGSPRVLNVQWSAVAGAAKYEVVVDCDSCANTSGFGTYNTYSMSSSATSLTATLPEDKTYSVYVKAYDQNGVLGSASTKVTFRFAPQAAAVSTIVPPTIVGPTAGAVLAYYPRVIHTSWWKVAGASAYVLSLECQSCSGSNGWKELSSYTIDNFYGTAYSYDIPAVASDADYRIRMRSLDGMGKAGAWSDYTYFRFTTVNLAAPVISTPTTNQTLTNSPRTFAVRWNMVSNAVSYVVEVSCKTCTAPQWSQADYYSTTDASNSLSTVAVNSDDSYRVRVQAVDQYGNHSPWSDYVPFSFNTSPPTQILAPRITAPADGPQVTSPTNQVAFSWTSVGSSYRYEVAIDCDSCGSVRGWHYWKTVMTPDTSTSILLNLPVTGLYRFQVRAIDIDGNRAGQWSNQTTFGFARL